MNPPILLLDNGSIRPEAILALRRIADRLGALTGRTFLPTSIAHSDRVPPDDLGGEPARLLEDAVREQAEAGIRRILIAPMFLAAGGAIVQLANRTLERSLGDHPGTRVQYLPFPFDEGRSPSYTVAAVLAEQIRETLGQRTGEQPPVLVVDHGSPTAAAAAVRNFIAGQVSVLLGSEAGPVLAASMERREGDAYAFNDPLLEDALRTEACRGREVVCGLLFLLPGRHAGEDGDIARICRRAEAEDPHLRVHRTLPLGEHPLMLQHLARLWGPGG